MEGKLRIMKKLFLVSSFKNVANQLLLLEKELKGKTITVISTASRDSKIAVHIILAKRALKKLGFTIEMLDIATTSFKKASQILTRNDVIYVAGGNTFFLMQELKKSGTDQIIIDEINRGKLYIGESAGAMILAKSLDYITALDSPKKAPELKNYTGLGMIDFYPLPHYGNFPFRKATKKIVQEWGNNIPLHPMTNNQGIIIEEKKKQLVTAS